MTGTAGLLLDQRVRPTEPFEWAWSLHPSVLVGTALLGALYFWGIGPWRRRQGLPPARPAQVASFSLALALLVVSLNGPIHDLSDYYLFWVHMLQHLVLTLAFPILLLHGTPGWLLEPLARHPRVRPAAEALRHPVVAGTVFTVVLAFWHVVRWYQLMMESHDVHVFTHVLFMVAATIMWFPVFGSAPSLPRLSPLKAMLYVFLVSVPMQAIAAIIVFADDPLYQWYVPAPRVEQLGSLSALEDQKLGGLLMWIPGNLWMFGVIATLFFQWVREHGETDRAEARTRREAATAHP